MDSGEIPDDALAVLADDALLDALGSGQDLRFDVLTQTLTGWREDVLFGREVVVQSHLMTIVWCAVVAFPVLLLVLFVAFGTG